MRNCLLFGAAMTALLVCVSSAESASHKVLTNAYLLQEDGVEKGIITAYTVGESIPDWTISGLFGTANSVNFEPVVEDFYGYADKWRLVTKDNPSAVASFDDVSQPSAADILSRQPDGSGWFAFDADETDKGLYIIETEFTFTGKDSVALGSYFELYFTNWSSGSNGDNVALFLNGNQLELVFAGNTNRGVINFEFDYLNEGANYLTLQFDYDGTLNDGSANVGIAFDKGADSASVVPEPATVLIMGLGLLGSGLGFRRRISK